MHDNDDALLPIPGGEENPETPKNNGLGEDARESEDSKKSLEEQAKPEEPRKRRIIVDEAFPQTEEADASRIRRAPWRERTRTAKKQNPTTFFQPLTEILRKEEFLSLPGAARPRSKPEGPPILKIEHLSVKFGEATVLRDLDFEIKRGETIAVIGESGCGKTVLLKTIIGLLFPSEGKVLFDGLNWTELNEKDAAIERMRFGFLFQQAALFDSMTIRENIGFPLQQHSKMTEAEIDEVVIGLLAEVGLSPSVMEKRPAEISGGMRKRVGFARALAMNPEVMLYDEPTTGLDPIMSDVINELILSTKINHQATGIMVTHDMKSAQKVADRIIMLYPVARLESDAPQVIYDGEAHEIEFSRDTRVAQFIRGEARERLMEMNENSNYEHKNGNGDTYKPAYPEEE